MNHSPCAILLQPASTHRLCFSVFYLTASLLLPNLDGIPSTTENKSLNHQTINGRKIASYTVFSSLDLKSACRKIPIRDEDKAFTAFKACGNMIHFSQIPFGVTHGVSCFQRVIDQITAAETFSTIFVCLDNITFGGKDEEHHPKESFMDLRCC